jgi:hypothetical protein
VTFVRRFERDLSTLRDKEALIPALVIPVFFFAVNIGQLQTVFEKQTGICFAVCCPRLVSAFSRHPLRHHASAPRDGLRRRRPCERSEW